MIFTPAFSGEFTAASTSVSCGELAARAQDEFKLLQKVYFQGHVIEEVRNPLLLKLTEFPLLL